MNFKQYFDQIDNVKIEKNATVASKKMLYCNKLTNKLNKLLSLNLIDMPDHAFMLNFIKVKGNMTNAKRYYEIIKHIQTNDQVENDDKKEIYNACRCLFKHLYDLFGDGIICIDDIKIDQFIKTIEEYNKNSFAFTNDQRIAIKNICYFLYDTTAKTFGLYGFAGTGKTTSLVKLAHYLLHKNYINSIALAAPTNVAVNVIKSKFRSDIDDLVKSKLKNNVSPNESFDDILDKLEEKGINIKFMTIHKLLNYQNDFDIEGERVFIKGDNASLDNYDVVVVDECSMIPMQIIANIFEEANRSELIMRKPKNIIFMGDICQLSPVREHISIVFATKKSDFDFKIFQTAYMNNLTSRAQKDADANLLQLIQLKFNALQKQILEMKFVILKQVMRSSNSQVIGICNEIRAAVLKEIKVPNLAKFKGNKVFLYKSDNNIKKVNTNWFKKAVEYFSVIDDKLNMSNIILAWTNKQTNEYNDTIRQIIHKKTDLNKYEIGDVLMLTEFYNIKEDDQKNNKFKKELIDSNVFYTSEQIKITDIEHVTKAIPDFTENLTSHGISRIKNSNDIIEKYIRTVKLINKNTTRKYNAWKLYVHKLAELITDKISQTHAIYVCNDDSKETLTKDRKYVAECIKELRLYYKNYHKENLLAIDKLVIRVLWKEVNQKLVDPFAKVNHSASCTTHKSQSASFYNVFVDVDDIFKNQDIDEAKRLFYTAASRTRNELHILI